MRVDIKSITLKNSTYNLNEPLSLIKEDLSQLVMFFQGKDSVAQAAVSVDAAPPIEVTNYATFLANSNIATNLQEYLIYPEQSQFNIDDLIQNKSIATTSPEGLTDSNEKHKALTASLSQEELANFNKLSDILVKIKKIDKEISDYQNQKSNKEGLNSKISETETLKSNLEQKLASVQSLLDGKTKVESEIAKVQSENAHHPSEEIDRIKENRINDLNQKLSGGFKQASGHQMYEVEPDPVKLKHKWMIALVIVQVSLSLIYFLISSNIGLLVIGLGLGLLFLVIFVVIQVTSKEKSTKVAQKAETVSTQQQDVQSNTTREEDNKMVKGAYLNALLSEKENIDSIINKSLGNQSFESVQESLNKANQDLELAKKSLTDSEGNTIDIDSYYKKRRELDILKIEKENLEFSSNLSVKPDEEYINLLLQGPVTESTSSTKIYLPLILISNQLKFDEIIEKYNNIRQVIVLYETIQTT